MDGAPETDLDLLWRAVEERYDDARRHDAFLAACAARGAFLYAAERYRQVLATTPGDPVAQARREEIQRSVLAWALSRRRDVRARSRALKVALCAVLGALLLAGLYALGSLLARMRGLAP